MSRGLAKPWSMVWRKRTAARPMDEFAVAQRRLHRDQFLPRRLFEAPPVAITFGGKKPSEFGAGCAVTVGVSAGWDTDFGFRGAADSAVAAPAPPATLPSEFVCRAATATPGPSNHRIANHNRPPENDSGIATSNAMTPIIFVASLRADRAGFGTMPNAARLAAIDGVSSTAGNASSNSDATEERASSSKAGASGPALSMRGGNNGASSRGTSSAICAVAGETTLATEPAS